MAKGVLELCDIESFWPVGSEHFGASEPGQRPVEKPVFRQGCVASHL